MASDNASSTASPQDQWLQHLGVSPDSFTGEPTDAGHVREGQASTLPTFGVSAAPDGTKPPDSPSLEDLEVQRKELKKEISDLTAAEKQTKHDLLIMKKGAADLISRAGGPTPRYGPMYNDVDEANLLKEIRDNPSKKAFAAEAERLLNEIQSLRSAHSKTWIKLDEAEENERHLRQTIDFKKGQLKKGDASGGKAGGAPPTEVKAETDAGRNPTDPKAGPSTPQSPAPTPQTSTDPNTPPAKPEPPNTPSKATQPIAGPVKSLDDVAAKAEELDRKTQELKKKATEAHKQLDESHSQVEEGKLKEQLEGLENERAAIEESLDNLARKIEALPEMKGVGGSTTRETFEKFRERFSKIVGVGEKLARWGGKLVNNYGLIMQLKEVFEAKTAQEAMDRAAALGGAVRDQVITSSVMESFLPEGPPGVSLAMNLCGDNDYGAGCEPDPDKVREERQKATTDGLNEAFEKYMKEMHPELFVQGPNGTYPSDEKLWNESKQQFQEAYERHQKDNVNGRAKELAERARAQKIENGLYDSPLNRFDPEDPDADPLDQERAKVIGAAVAKAQDEGYKEGKARRDAIWKRANDLGLQDGKTGKPAGMEEIPKWPELQTSADMSDQQALARTTFLNQLLGVYKTAFDSIAPKNAAGSTEGKLTAGEMAAQDQKAEALKRAKQYGLEDGKKSKRLRGEEIQKWREVLNREGSDRAALLHELIETYNQAFASVAPPTTAAAGDGKTSAREMVARDRKAAALKRAQELGTSDGKLGQKLSIEKIQAWPEVTEQEAADRATFLHQLLEAYNKAFDTVPKKAGPTAGQMADRDKKDAALKRAREMGTRDGKAGSRVNFEDIQEWEVVTELEGTARGAFLHELLEAYNQAFDAVPVRLTAGEMVAGDKRTAAIQRARDWGLKDGKAGKVSDMKEIQTWPAVAVLEPIARGPFIAQLIGVYNKAQAESVAMNKSPTAATTK